MQNSLLAHIASNFISEYENVANSSIAYLLNTYPAAQMALASILDLPIAPTYYETELATAENGRPDVTGRDQNGAKTVIIEGKFWANLTDNQPVNYLKELASDGKILFLAPSKRLNSLQIEIDKRTYGNTGRIHIFSWLAFLNLVEQENNKNHNHQLASDLMQLHELCQKMDSEGLPPLSASDLDPSNGRLMTHFVEIIDMCNPILREWEPTNFRGVRTQSFKYGHGFYFFCYEFSCYLFFSSKYWFERDNHVPIWLTVKTVVDGNWVEAEEIRHLLQQYDGGNAYYNDFGIHLETGMDSQEAVKQIVTTVKSVMIYLNQHYQKL